jgi:hypothetical protein
MTSQDAINKWPTTTALVEGHALPSEIDAITNYLTGGANNVTPYFEGAARRARFVLGVRVERSLFRHHWVPRPPVRCTDADYPVDCGSRFD